MAKIFISHSSKDKELVDLFKNLILNTGLGIVDRDIAYTSAPETGVPTGESIPQYIKKNIAESDCVFFMISENYRKSEVCLNEMGAAWALDKNVKPLLVNDVSFESVGWLYGVNFCARINDGDRLDELRDEFKKYGSQTKTVVWNRQKQEFISAMSTHMQTRSVLSVLSNDEELGLLDYRDAFQKHMHAFGVIVNVLMQANVQFNERWNRYKLLETQKSQHPLSVKEILVEWTEAMHLMADSIDANASNLKREFRSMMDNASKIIQLEKDASTQTVYREDLQKMLDCVISIRDNVVGVRDALRSVLNMEKAQIAARKRLENSCSILIAIYDECVSQLFKCLNA